MPSVSPSNPLEVTNDPGTPNSDTESEHDSVPPIRPPRRPRRLSTYESSDGGMDLEGPEYGGSARPRSVSDATR